MSLNRILILGSVASGKTTLARKLSKMFLIPIIHIDTIEFNADLSKKNRDEIRNILQLSITQHNWILDGHGPLDLLPQHFKNADTIIFLDLPLYLSCLWLLKRQLTVVFNPRLELPKSANEWQIHHLKKMVTTLFKQHRLMNPELRRLFLMPEMKNKVVHVKSIVQLAKVVSDLELLK